MMFKKTALATWLAIGPGLLTGAQEKDSTWYYANQLTDYATADLACLLRIDQTKILDTIGGYTVQEVSFEPLQFYKGQTGQRKFRAWLESHEVVWKAGTIRGYYLLKGSMDTVAQGDRGSGSYYWLENAGFALEDTALLAKMADTARFKQMVTQYILPGIGGSWAKVSLVGMKGEQAGEHGPVTATIRLEEDVPALQLKKGNNVPVIIWDAYRSSRELGTLLHKKGTWEVVLSREDGQLNMKTAFMRAQ